MDDCEQALDEAFGRLVGPDGHGAFQLVEEREPLTRVGGDAVQGRFS